MAGHWDLPEKENPARGGKLPVANNNPSVWVVITDANSV
jgi:hypothetical protein